MTSSPDELLLDLISFNVNAVAQDVQPRRDGDRPLIGQSFATDAYNSLSTVFTNYAVPPEAFLRLANTDRKNEWITPAIPPTVSLDRWKAIEPPRLAYVREYNWERKGVRGMFLISHYGRGSFGLEFLIAKPISPSLYLQLGSGNGQASQRYAVWGRNTWWVSAVIGAYEDNRNDPVGGQFIVHYNDDGVHYHRIRLPYEAFLDYLKTVVDADLLPFFEKPVPPPTVPRSDLASGGSSSFADVFGAGGTASFATGVPSRPDVVQGLPPSRAPTAQYEIPPFAAESIGETLGDPVSLAATPGEVAGATPDSPLINETFWQVDMRRFWPQFMTALELVLYSPVRSKDLLALLERKHNWTLVQVYMERNRDGWAWLSPKYRLPICDGESVGNQFEPDYLK